MSIHALRVFILSLCVNTFFAASTIFAGERTSIGQPFDKSGVGEAVAFDPFVARWKSAHDAIREHLEKNVRMKFAVKPLKKADPKITRPFEVEYEYLADANRFTRIGREIEDGVSSPTALYVIAREDAIYHVKRFGPQSFNVIKAELIPEDSLGWIANTARHRIEENDRCYGIDLGVVLERKIILDEFLGRTADEFPPQYDVRLVRDNGVRAYRATCKRSRTPKPKENNSFEMTVWLQAETFVCYRVEWVAQNGATKLWELEADSVDELANYRPRRALHSMYSQKTPSRIVMDSEVLVEEFVKCVPDARNFSLEQFSVPEEPPPPAPFRATFVRSTWVTGVVLVAFVLLVAAVARAFRGTAGRTEPEPAG